MYAKSVLEHIPADKNTYIFYAFDINNPIKDLNIKLQNDYQLIQTPNLKTQFESLGDIFALIRLLKHRFKMLKPLHPDVFIQFDFSLGFPEWHSIKKVTVAYDLIPLIKRSEYMPGVRFAWQHSSGKREKARAVARSIYYTLKYKLNYNVYKKADAIISISEATTQSYIELLGVHPDKITTIPLAPVSTSAELDNSLVKKIPKPYIFYVGGTDSRKRIEDVVHAFNIVRGRGMDLALVLAGNEFNDVQDVPNIEARDALSKSSYKSDIHLVGFISDAQKAALYHSARALVFCSVYEGFGLPIIEAMAASCPVIAYNNSSIPEAAGNAALLVPTSDYLAVAHQILALRDDSIRHALITKGITQAKKFNWETYISHFTQVIFTPKRG
jgi:glycosyltransferase involved in cell wall biosynthesis